MNKEMLDAFLKYLSEYYAGRPAPVVEFFPSNDVSVPVLDGVGPLNEDEFVQALNAGFGMMQQQQPPQAGLMGGLNQMQPAGLGMPAADPRLMN